MKCVVKTICGLILLLMALLTLGCAGGSEAGNPIPIVPVIGDATGDDDDITGGECTYIQTLGTAEIISITPAPAETYNCPNNPVEVVFDFTPENPIDESDNDKGQRMTVGAGMNPSLDLITAKGIAVGNVYICIRNDIETGTCTPWIFTFPNIDLSDYDEYCY